MPCKYDLELEGLEAASRLFDSLQPDLKRATKPVIQEMAQRIASSAKANANNAHPRNLFRTPGSGRRLTPNYRPKKNGEFWWLVQTPGTAAGKAEAISEFAAAGYTGQGAAMVRALNNVYGREGGPGGGRILYKARDDMEPSLTQMFTDAVNKSAAEMDRSLNG